MKFLRADDEIEMRQAGEQSVAARLRHAAEKTEDDLRATLRQLAHHAHFAERLLVGHVAHAAGVEQDDVGVALVGDRLVTSFQK